MKSGPIAQLRQNLHNSLHLWLFFYIIKVFHPTSIWNSKCVNAFHLQPPAASRVGNPNGNRPVLKLGLGDVSRSHIAKPHQQRRRRCGRPRGTSKQAICASRSRSRLGKGRRRMFSCVARTACSLVLAVRRLATNPRGPTIPFLFFCSCLPPMPLRMTEPESRR